MPDLPHTSIIVPTHRRRDALQRLLRSLCAQAPTPHGVEVVVVVDGSQDGTQEMVASFQAPFSLRSLWQPNRGRAAACNAGIHAARGEIIVLLDDDMQPTPQYLSAHLKAHRRSPGKGVLGPVPMRRAQRRHKSAVVRYTAYKFDHHLQKLSHTGGPVRLTDFYTGNFSISRSLLLETGLFDEQFKIYGNEDLELYCRLQNHGVEIVFCPGAVAYQQYDKEPAAWARDNIAEGRTSVMLACKHPETFGELILATYDTGIKVRRLIRNALLAWAHRSSTNVEHLIALTRWLDRRPLPRIDKLYYAMEDLYYWLGVRRELYDLQGTERFHQFIQMWQQYYGAGTSPLPADPIPPAHVAGSGSAQ